MHQADIKAISSYSFLTHKYQKYLKNLSFSLEEGHSNEAGNFHISLLTLFLKTEASVEISAHFHRQQWQEWFHQGQYLPDQPITSTLFTKPAATSIPQSFQALERQKAATGSKRSPSIDFRKHH